MKVACCFSGPNRIPKKCNDFLATFSNITYFQYVEHQNFENTIAQLGIKKQKFELEKLQQTSVQTESFFDVCVYIDTLRSFDEYNKLTFTDFKKNTLYSLSKFVNDEEKVFNLFPQYYVDTGFFYCDSKTFNLISQYNKYKNITVGMYTVPANTLFYSYIQCMGIKNRSLLHD